MIRHLCTLWSDHPDRLTSHLTSYIVIKMLLTIIFILYFTSLYICFLILLKFIVVQVQLSLFPHHHFPLPHPPPLPTLNTTLLWLCLCVLYACSLMTLPFSPLISPPSFRWYCQFVLYFNISGYILRACLFCWLGSTYRWDRIIFIFHSLPYFT